MGIKRQITEYLDVDLSREVWCCNRCGKELISARSNYKEGCLVYERDPRDLYEPIPDAPFGFAPDPAWIRYLEFYCPGCGVLIEVEPLPPGHPVTHDIELDVDRLKAKHLVPKEEQ